MLSRLLCPRFLPCKFALLAALWCGLLGTAPAAEKIEGAFGIKLGQVFQPTAPPAKILYEEEAYAFTPEQPNPMFSTYFVCINPETRVVYKIVAGKDASVSDDYNQWEAKMAAFLHGKYDALPNAERAVKQGSRIVLVNEFTSSQPSQRSFFVEYSDNDLTFAALQVQYRSEQKKLEVQQKDLLKEVDPTGL